MFWNHDETKINLYQWWEEKSSLWWSCLRHAVGSVTACKGTTSLVFISCWQKKLRELDVLSAHSWSQNNRTCFSMTNQTKTGQIQDSNSLYSSHNRDIHNVTASGGNSKSSTYSEYLMVNNWHKMHLNNIAQWDYGTIKHLKRRLNRFSNMKCIKLMDSSVCQSDSIHSFTSTVLTDSLKQDLGEPQYTYDICHLCNIQP